MARRQPIKPVNVSAETVATQAATEKARKAASRKALRASKTEQQQAEREFTHGTLDTAALDEAIAETSQRNDDYEAQRHHDNLVAAQVEATATGMTLQEACESMGIDPATGAPVESEKRRYQGPMLALVRARQSYRKGANGNPHTNDAIGEAFSHLDRETVVNLCLRLMSMQTNPYEHLNPGQQSMNLRNKLRQMVRNKMLPVDHVVREAAKAGK